jgi:hypothetical protein
MLSRVGIMESHTEPRKDTKMGEMKITFSTDGDAFSQMGATLEVASILNVLSQRVAGGETEGKIRDTFGHTAGSWSLTVDPRHVISVDESDTTPRDGGPGTVPMFAAFCEATGCNWRGDWHHADDFEQIDGADDAADLAENEARQDGGDHLRENGESVPAWLL